MLEKGSVMGLKGGSGYPGFEKAVASIPPQAPVTSHRIKNTSRGNDVLFHVISITELKRLLFMRKV